MKAYFQVVLLVAAGFFISACATDEQVSMALRNNPDLVYEAMRKNPEKLMAVIREAAQKEQEGDRAKESLRMEEQMEKDFKNPRPADVSVERIFYGPVDAPITVIKYADFQCPACRMGYESLEAAKKKYPGKIRMIHKNIPLEQIHPLAKISAEIFEALVILDKSKAREFYKLAYETQGEWTSEKEVWKMLKKVGGDQKKIQAEIKKGEVAKRLAADAKEHQGLGFRGTPAYLINGVSLYGAPSAAGLSQIIDRLLKK